MGQRLAKLRQHGGMLAWYGQPRPLYSGGNELRLLRGGEQLFPAMCRAIARARHEVWLATYIFNEDPAAEQVVQALVAAARRGARVRLVVDGFGAAHCLNSGMLKRLERHGVAVAVFRPVGNLLSWLKPGQLRRLHMKLCVVDGETGFVGGINLMDDRYDLGHGWSPLPRLDYAVQAIGPVVLPIEHTLRAVWSRAWFGRDWRDELGDLLQDLARRPKRAARLRRLSRRLRMRPNVREAQHLMQASVDRRPVRSAFVVRDNFRQRRTIERCYIDAIQQAQHTVDLVCPYFYPGNAFRLALRHAARRGVKIRLLLQGKLDYRIAGWAAQAVYHELLGHGIRIFEYTPAFLHAKVAVVDGRWATVGSSNIDPLSLLVNLEANLLIQDETFAQSLAADLRLAFAASREVVDPAGMQGSAWAVLRRAMVAWVANVYLRVAGANERY